MKRFTHIALRWLICTVIGFPIVLFVGYSFPFLFDWMPIISNLMGGLCGVIGVYWGIKSWEKKNRG